MRLLGAVRFGEPRTREHNRDRRAQKKEVRGEPTVEARALARDGSRSRPGLGATAHVPCVGKLNSKRASKKG
jgi:hypothetical protein